MASVGGSRLELGTSELLASHSRIGAGKLFGATGEEIQQMGEHLSQNLAEERLAVADAREVDPERRSPERGEGPRDPDVYAAGPTR